MEENLVLVINILVVSENFIKVFLFKVFHRLKKVNFKLTGTERVDSKILH